ncbi:hypothetical protein MMC30_000484 [Trapelia coarctata]|nr:hypothetical protein [Trapelia coarctata]
MITGFEIFGAVNGALGALNLARTLFQYLYKTVQQYRGAGPKLLDLNDSFDNFEVRLSIWADCWDVRGTTPDIFYVALWSPLGWRSMSRQLAAIDKTSEDFVKVLSKLVDPKDLRNLDARLPALVIDEPDGTDPSQGANPVGLRAQRAAKTRALAKLAKKAVSWDDKAKFVLMKSDQLSEYLSELKDRFTLLSADALDFFAATHPSVERSASILTRRRIAAASMLLQRALQTKAASEALYQSCLSSSRRGTPPGIIGQIGGDNQSQLNTDKRTRLEMDLVLGGMDGFTSLHYHLLIFSPTSTSWQEILVEGPLQDKVQMGLTVQDLEAAWVALQTQQSCELQAALVDAQVNNTLHFHLTLPPDPIQQGSYREVGLSGLLSEIQARTSADSHEKFPVRERLELAYKVAECGLLLLGTSWLANISSKRVQRVSRPGPDQRRRYILEAGRETNELDSVEPQTFNVGVLLTEIATAQPVLRIMRFEMGNRNVELDLVMSSLRDGVVEQRKFRAAQVIKRVDEHMGQRYSEAVEFCLQQSQKYKRPEWARIREFGSWGEQEDAYRSILQDYYVMVYTP